MRIDFEVGDKVKVTVKSGQLNPHSGQREDGLYYYGKVIAVDHSLNYPIVVSVQKKDEDFDGMWSSGSEDYLMTFDSLGYGKLPVFLGSERPTVEVTEKYNRWASRRCTCDPKMLMNRGCQCGFLKGNP